MAYTTPTTAQTYGNAVAATLTNLQDLDTRLTVLEDAGADTVADEVEAARGSLASLSAYLLVQHDADGKHDFTSIVENLVSDPLDTPAYLSANQFTISGDVTAKYPTGAMLRFTISSSYYYSQVQSASYGAPNTTVTIEDSILTAGLTGVGIVLWYTPRRTDLEDDEALTDIVENNTGGILNAGTGVFLNAYAASGYKDVAAADNTNAAKLPVLGVLGASIANGATGNCVTIGAVTGLDTSTYTVNDVLYVSSTGALTDTVPATGWRYPVAIVRRVHATSGVIFVFCGIAAYIAMSGPTSSVINNIPVFADALGRRMKDSGVNISQLTKPNIVRWF